jgi:hypothetical protein
MKLKLSITGLVAALTMAALMGGIAADNFGNTAGIATFLLAFGLPLLKPFAPASWYKGAGDGLVLMAIQAEVWQNHIEGNLFKDNEFLLTATDAGQYVIQGKVVHIPQSGGLPAIEKNRSTLPATASERTDTEVSYLLDAYSTDPILIRNAEVFELSYNKRESVIGEYEAALRQRIADEILIKWAPTAPGCILRTGGDDVATHLTGTVGTRKALVTADLRAAQLKMNKQNISKYDRYALLSAEMFNQLLDSLSETQYRDFSTAMDPTTGALGMLYGFKILQRTDVVVYNETADAVNSYGALTAGTDNDAVLCWQKEAVERALGSITFFERANDPLYYGDVYSFEVRMGGRKRRNDQLGVVAIVQEEA